MNNTSITTRKVLGLGQYFVHTLPVYVHNGRLINSEYITKESEGCQERAVFRKFYLHLF